MTTIEITLPRRATHDWFESGCAEAEGNSARIVSETSRGTTVCVNEAALRDMLSRADYYTFQPADFDPTLVGLISSCRAVVRRLRGFDWSVFTR